MALESGETQVVGDETWMQLAAGIGGQEPGGLAGLLGEKPPVLIEAIDDYVENLTGDRRALHTQGHSIGGSR